MKPLVYRTKSGSYGLSVDGESVINAEGRLVPCDPAVWTEVPNGDPALASQQCRSKIPEIAEALEVAEKRDAERIEAEKWEKDREDAWRYQSRAASARRMNEVNAERRSENSPFRKLWRYLFGD